MQRDPDALPVSDVGSVSGSDEVPVSGSTPGPVTGVVGIGIDAVEVERFRRSLERTPSMRARLFTEVELDQVGRRADPVPALAARFAAREAVMKALGMGLGAFGFHEVWVDREASGRPVLRVVGTAAAHAAAAGVTQWHLSLTHTDTMAMAYVIAAGPGQGRGD